MGQTHSKFCLGPYDYPKILIPNKKKNHYINAMVVAAVPL